MLPVDWRNWLARGANNAKVESSSLSLTMLSHYFNHFFIFFLNICPTILVGQRCWTVFHTDEQGGWGASVSTKAVGKVVGKI